jgi:hypothetical protein
MNRTVRCLAVGVLLLLTVTQLTSAQEAKRVTIL